MSSKPNSNVRKDSVSADSDSSSTTSSRGSSPSRPVKRRSKKSRRSKYGKRRKMNTEVIEHLSQQVSDLKNFLYGNAYYPQPVENFQSVENEPVYKCENVEFLPDPLHIDFEFGTVLKEPSVPAATAEHLEILQSLQHFESENWNSVRYFDIQKNYNAKPGFVNLEINDELKGFVDKPNYLVSEEKFLAAMTHALIMQSAAFQNGFTKLFDWVNSCESLVMTDFKENCTNIFKENFLKISNDCLQLVCGRRADIIKQRREYVVSNFVKEKYLRESFNNIPPTYKFLFDKSSFSEIIKNNGGVSKVLKYNTLASGEKKNFSGSQTSRTGLVAKSGRSMASPTLFKYRPPYGVTNFPAYASNGDQFFRQIRPRMPGPRFQRPQGYPMQYAAGPSAAGPRPHAPAGPRQHAPVTFSGRSNRKY